MAHSSAMGLVPFIPSNPEEEDSEGCEYRPQENQVTVERELGRACGQGEESASALDRKPDLEDREAGSKIGRQRFRSLSASWEGP